MKPGLELEVRLDTERQAAGEEEIEGSMPLDSLNARTNSKAMAENEMPCKMMADQEQRASPAWSCNTKPRTDSATPREHDGACPVFEYNSVQLLSANLSGY